MTRLSPIQPAPTQRRRVAVPAAVTAAALACSDQVVGPVVPELPAGAPTVVAAVTGSAAAALDPSGFFVLPDPAVADGTEPLLVIGAMAGG